jgi:small multidrug resistance family-3 protein
MPIVAKSTLLFVLAGLSEISGGYLVWQWWRAGAHWGAGVVGALVLVLYGIVPTYQPAHFGRVYSAYGGWFVVLSMLWGWSVDRVPPDR